MKCYRVTSFGVGIYEKVKLAIWDKSKIPEQDWNKFKSSANVTWLPVPNCYANPNLRYNSYFTEKGFSKFNQLTFPLIKKWINKKDMEIKEYDFILDCNVVYIDEYQIVKVARNSSS